MKIKLLFICISTTLITNINAQNYFVSTYAGDGTSGNSNGISFNASFNRPSSLCLDSLGNMYVADWGNHTIRKITAGGTVTTLAGSGSAGFTNGTGTGASFDKPGFITIHHPTGDLYVSEIGNNCIRKVTQAGVVTTYAGTGAAGYVDGPSASAQFDSPLGLEFDAMGNLYVIDRLNVRIRKISTTGVVSTVAGDGTVGFLDGAALSARFNVPSDLDINSQGLIFIADRDNDRIRVFDPVAGTVSTYAGNGGTTTVDGTLSTSSFNAPRGIFINEHDDIYVNDQDGNKIRKISGNSVTTIAGNGNSGYQDGPGTSAEFNLPWDVAYFQGIVYVAGDFDNSIRMIVKNFSPNAIVENELLSLHVFPNPATNIVNFQVNSSVSLDITEISIYNLSGQLVMSEPVRNFSNGEVISLNVDGLLTRGAYIFTISKENQILATAPVLIE